jgi:DNA repair ATPase RecN
MRLPVLLLLPLLMLPACAGTLLLRQHHQTLVRLNTASLSPEEAYDGLATVLVAVIQDANRFPHADQRIQFLRKFAKQNNAEIRGILQRLDAMQANMRPVEKVQFLANMIRKSSTSELIRLLPDTLELLKEEDGELGDLRKLLLLYRIRQWMND